MRMEKFTSLNASDVARVFGVSDQAVGGWPKNGCPRNKDRTFDLPAVAQWRIEWVREDERKKAPVAEGGALEKKRAAEARLSELDLMEREGQLIPLAEVEEGRRVRIRILKRYLLALPKTVAGQLVGLDAKEIKSILNDHMRDILNQFAGEGKK